MISNRKHERFIKRLETQFSSGNLSYRGISSDLSFSGIFIRTKNPFTIGSVIDIILHLPDGTDCRLKGKVMRAFKSQLAGLKNGMGILLLEKDDNYLAFIRSHDSNIPQEKTASPNPETLSSHPSQPEFSIIACPSCGAKNKVQAASISKKPKCGKCGSPLVTETSSSAEEEFSIIPCPSCGVKNKVQAARISKEPKCGKCGSPLVTHTS